MGHRIEGRSSGFTLIETIAALLVFSIITLGVGPLIISSIRGSNLTRSLSVGRQLAVQAMERARGLPYHVKRNVSDDVDLLDLYYPRRGPDPLVFITRCPSSPLPLGCPQELPDGYSLVFEARFVELDGTPVEAPATYDARTVGADRPPELLVELVVRSEWDVLGRDRSFELKSLLSDRKFGGLRMSGFGKINYAIDVQTTYQNDSLEVLRNVIARGGLSESRIETRRDSRAEQTVRAAELRLVDQLAFEEPDLVPPVLGAVSAVVAPPDSNPAGVNAGPATLRHPAPLSGDVAGIDSTSAGPGTPTEADVRVTANSLQLPSAQGGFSFVGGLGPDDFWVDKPEVGGVVGLLRLNTTDRLVYLGQPLPGPGIPPPPPVPSLSGFTRASTTALPAGAVITEAHVELSDLTILPTQFAIDGVVNVGEFTADVDCRAAGPFGSPANPTASWSATIRYWAEPNNANDEDDPGDDITGNGNYQTVNLSSGGTDELTALKESNPLVFERGGFSSETVRGSHPDDVFLFPQRHEHQEFVGTDANGDPIFQTTVHEHEGYLSDWRMLLEADFTNSFAADGRSVASAIEGALGIVTVPIAEP
ncbi:MAG TPA: type II secretion system protein, partial [Actinomycetota bacterium]|nr:type II secretion system protein [Actinomycetota bacterium]